MTGPEGFYDALAPFYHLIFPGPGSQHRAAGGGAGRGDPRGDRVEAEPTVLDVACGIGTQALGLAALGYRVTASDLSAGAVARLRDEAARRGVKIDAKVADVREA